MRVQWHRIKEDAAEGFRIFREEVQVIFRRTLVSTERAQMRRALYQVEEALQERYQEVGEKIYRHLTGAERRFMGKDFAGDFAEIERLQAERQRMLEELKTGEESDFSRS
jgi:hypothetical protein